MEPIHKDWLLCFLANSMIDCRPPTSLSLLSLLSLFPEANMTTLHDQEFLVVAESKEDAEVYSCDPITKLWSSTKMSVSDYVAPAVSACISQLQATSGIQLDKWAKRRLANNIVEAIPTTYLRTRAGEWAYANGMFVNLRNLKPRRLKSDDICFEAYPAKFLTNMAAADVDRITQLLFGSGGSSQRYQYIGQIGQVTGRDGTIVIDGPGAVQFSSHAVSAFGSTTELGKRMSTSTAATERFRDNRVVIDAFSEQDLTTDEFFTWCAYVGKWSVYGRS